MQKGTVIESGVLHNSHTAQNVDGGKTVASFFDLSHEGVCSNPAKNSKKENGHNAKKENDHTFKKQSRFNMVMGRVAAIFLAAVMTVSMAGLASDAIASTTPYTNIDVPLNISGGDKSSNNPSDNADPDRVETDGVTSEKGYEAGVLGPLASSVSGRNSGGDSPNEGDSDLSAGQAASEDDLTFTSNYLTYKCNVNEKGEGDGTYTLLYADPKVGKVAALSSSVSSIAEGAFVDCPELETIIVHGTIKSIAETERSIFGKIIKQGAFTDDQIKNVHVVFAVNVMEQHDHSHERAAGTDTDANNSHESETDAEGAESETPVAQGIKILSGDVYLSTSVNDAGSKNAWTQIGFKNIVAAPEIGLTSQADPRSASPQNASSQDSLTFTLLSDYTLEVAKSEDADLPAALVIPSYGQIDGTTYQVKQIASGAFKGCGSLQALVIEDGIADINDAAFAGCMNLKEITLPNTLASIGDSAFRSTGIIDIQIPATVSSIGDYAFADCTGLEQVTQKTVGDGEEAEGNDAQALNEIYGDIDEADAETDLEDRGYGLEEYDGDAVNSTIFEGCSPETKEEFYRTVYKLGSGKFNHVTIDSNGGTWSGQRYSSQSNAKSGTKSSVTGTGNREFWYGNKGTIHIGKYVWKNGKWWDNWTTVNGIARENGTFFTATKTGYHLNYVEKTGPGSMVFYCGACDNDVWTDDEVDQNGGSTYKLIWAANTYTVAYDKNQPTKASSQVTGSTPSSSHTYGIAKGLRTNGYQLTGWSFMGWNTKADGSGKRYDNEDLVESLTTANKGKVTLFAQWAQNTYNVTLNGNGGTPSQSSVLVVYDSYYPDLGTATSTVAGREFAGWYTDRIGGDKVTTFTQCVTASDHTLYAHWITENYKVTLDANGGLVGSQSELPLESTKQMTVKYNDYYVFKSDKGNYYNTVVREGYSFIGWYTKRVGGSPISMRDDSSYTSTTRCTQTSDHTLYAHWQSNIVVPVTVDANGGHIDVYDFDTGEMTSREKITVNLHYEDGYIEAFDESRYSARYGYIGDGYYTDPVGGTRISEDAICNRKDAHTIYQHWIADSFRVKLHSSGGYIDTFGEEVDTAYIHVTFDEYYDFSDIDGVYRPGYRFTGWYTDSYSTSKRITSNDKCSFSAEDHPDLWAHWEIARYDITLSAANASGTNETSLTESNGWSLSADGKSLTKRFYENDTLGILPTTVTRPGYKFIGWGYVDASGTDAMPKIIDGEETEAQRDTTFYAVWSFSVTYIGNGNTGGVVPGGTTYYTGSSGSASHVVSTDVLTRRNYNWYGWVSSDVYPTTTASPTRQIGEKTLRGDTSYYAAWSFTISYNGNGNTGGTAPNSVVYYSGASGSVSHTVPSTTTLTRTDYEFDGWYTAATGGNKVTTFTAAGDQTLYAHWKLMVFTITLDASNLAGTNAASCVASNGWTKSGDGKSLTKDCVLSSELGTLPVATRVGYAFIGWSENNLSSGATAIPSCINASTTVSGAKTYYAVWSFTVSYDGNGNTGGMVPASTTYYTGSSGSATHTVPTITNLTKVGYTFDKWWTAPTGGTQVTTSVFMGNTTIYAHWKGIDYFVQYDKNKPANASHDVVGSMLDSKHVYGTPSSLTQNAYTLTGWTFNGWNTARDGSGTPYKNLASVSTLTTTPNGTVVLYAQWDANEYIIQYNKNKPTNASHDVGGETRSSAHVYDTPSLLTANGYTLTGWTFKEWNTKADGTGDHYQNNATVSTLATSGTVTLYAQWVANTYYVSYSSNFTQSAYPNSRVLYNDVPSAETMRLSTHIYDTSKELSANLYGVTGYDFNGWSRNANGTGDQYMDRQSVKNLTDEQGGTVVIYAKWDLRTYAITVNTVGGRMPGDYPTSYNINSATQYIGNPSKPAYDFTGWSVTGVGPYGREPVLNVGDSAQIVTGTYGDLHFTAGWADIEYSVQYDLDGGTGPDFGTTTVKYGQSFTVAQGTGKIFKEGYTFSGKWKSSRNNQLYEEGRPASNLTTVSGDVVILSAVWEANRYDLTLDAAGGQIPDTVNWTVSNDRGTASKKASYNERIGNLPIPTRQGYEFDYWHNEQGERVDSTTVYARADNMLLTARWIAYTYTVYFYKNAPGATGFMQPLDFSYGSEQPLTPNNFEYNGHTFLGWARSQWATAPDFKDGESVSNLTTDYDGKVFLYAVWSENHYSINYYSNNAEVAEGSPDPYRQDDIAYTDRFYPPHAADLGFSLTGYAFAGWSDMPDGSSGKLYKDVDEITEALTDADGVTVNLWAQWEPATYRLTLDATGGRFDATLFQTVGQIWSPETNYVGAYRQIKYDEQYLCTIEPVWTGYDFAGWYTEPQGDPYKAGTGDGHIVSASDLFKNLEDTTIYAHWTPHTYTLNLVYYNSESMTDTILLGQTLYFNEPFVLPTAGYKFEDINFPSYGHTLKDYQKTGFAVSGWSITREGETNYRLGQTISGLDSVGDPDKPYTLYLTQAAGRYTVEFDPGVPPDVDVENLMLPETWLYTDYVDVPWCSMKRTGYTFTYWTTNVDDRTYTPGYGQKFHQMVDIGETLVLTAHWKANEITLRFMDGDVVDKTITYGTQITRVAKAVSDSKLTFEGWYTKRDGSLDQCYFDWNGNVNQKNSSIYPYWYDAGNENGVIELWAKWTFEVKFEFPYGGRDVSITPSNYSAGQTYGDPSNATNFRPSYGLPIPKYNGLDSNVDNDGNVRRFAGWYDAAVGGNLVTNDTLATGPVQPDPWSDYEDVVLYARWYVDVTLDYPTYAPYTEGWAFEYGRDLAHVENDRGQVVVSYVQGIPYAGDASFMFGLPRAERAGYTYLGWNANERKAIFDGESRLFEGEIQSGDIVTSERNYAIYLEYAKRQVDVKVRYWQQVIEGVDADGNPTIGAVPAIASDDIYTTSGHYKLVEADTRAESLFSEDEIDDGAYHGDPAAGDDRYRGFTYSTTLISKDANAEGETDSDAMLIWDGATTPEQARPDLYDGCVASDGMTVVDVFYTRNKYDVMLHDFEIVDGAGETQVRATAHARALSSNALAYSPAEAATSPGRESVLQAWFEEDLTLVGTASAGYDFAGWDIEPVSLGLSHDVVNDDPSTRLEGDVYTFTITGSDLEVTPRGNARTDTPYSAILHYQNLESATSVNDDKVTWAKSNPITLYGETDALTGWVLRSEASDASASDVIESMQVEIFDATGFPEDVSFAGSFVFDPVGFTATEIENAVVRTDNAETLHVYYSRDSYPVVVKGYEAVHKDGTGVGDVGRIAGYLWDVLGGAPAMPGDTEAEASNETAYKIYFAAPISVVAVPAGGTELLGYASSMPEVWGTKALAEYAGDIDIELDADAPNDSEGLVNTNANNPYTFKYDGVSGGRNMPVVPTRDGAQETLTLAIEGQPARTSYEVIAMLQDAATETEPAYGSYSEYAESKVFTATTIDGNARLLRLWSDGTYVDANRSDFNYVPDIKGFEPTSNYAPALYGYEIYREGVVDLTELTPDGNAGFHGVAIEPLNKAYVYMDRIAPITVGYSYASTNDESALTEEIMSTLPESVTTYFGAEVRVADAPHVNGWDFMGWTWNGTPVGEGTDLPAIMVPEVDVEIVGTWSPREYGLSFDGGTAYDESPATGIPADMAIPFGSEWAVPDAEPERGGYTFVGWTFAERAVFEAIVNGSIDLAAGDVDGYRAALAAMSDLDGNPLILEPGQSQVWSWHKGDRTLHAVWMRNSYNVTFDLGNGGWPTGTTVPLTYMTGAEVRIPQPASEGYAFTGWEIACEGSALEGDAPAVSYTDDDPTRAVINAWAYGDIAFTAQYDVIRYAVNLNPAGGTFDGEPAEFMGRDVDYASPDGEAPYGQATVYIPFNTEINASTPLPEPERPGYDFAGWTDAEGNPIGWTLGDDGARVDAPYTFDSAKDATWVATWRAHRYQITYNFGEHSDAVTVRDADRFSEYYAGMTDASGSVVTSFMLPTADDIEGLPEGVGFDGWYPAGGNPDSDRMRSFDPNAETGDKEFVAVFSTGANVYTERFWLEVLDQSEDVEGRQYAYIGDTKFMLDETLSVTRRTDQHNAIASMSAISGFAPVDPYKHEYPTEQPYMCIFSSGQDTVNGFYTRETHALAVGTANGIDDDETLIQVSPASALVRDADAVDGSYAVDADANTATLKGASDATVKWGAAVSVGVTCPRETGYAFTTWRTDAGATPADIDVRANPAAFTMPDADVALDPTTELIRFTAKYIDIFGKDVAGAGQATFTVLDEFALANLDDISGYTFRGWEAYVADEDGNKLDPETNPVPATVGYDEAQEYMRVREGTATDLLFEAKYSAVEYTVSVTLPKGTAYLPSGMPDGLPQVDGVEWVLMHGGDADTDVIGFTYTVEDLSDSLVIDLTGIKCAPYRVDGWTVAGANGEASMPELSGGVLTLTNANLGDWNLTPDVSPIRYTLTLDLTDVRDGYVPLDVDVVRAELEAAGYEVRDGDVPGTLDVTFDVETADAYTLPSFEKENEDDTPDSVFRGWAKDGDSANALNPYILPPADIAVWPETGTVIAPVWAKSGEMSTLVAHLPNEKGEYTDDYRFTFTGDALTPIDYAQDGRFLDIVNDVDGTNVGYHLVWHTDVSLTDDNVTTLPANFPEQGTQEVWGEWVEDDDIITVGFGVKWDNSAPPGETKPRSVFALNANDVADHASAVAAYSDDEAAIGDTADDADGDAVETPIADANSTYYYIPNRGLYTKDANGKYHIVTRIANINDIAGSYAGWRLEGFYLPIDTADPKRIIIGPDGTVDNATFVKVAGSKPSDLTFTVRWARISLVEVDMAGGYGDDSEDITFCYWPEKDVFVKGDDAAIGDAYSAPRTYAKDDFNTGVMLGTFAAKGIPGPKEDADGTHAFIGYFGKTANGSWDYAKDAEGNPLPAANALALTDSFSYLAVTDDYKKQATVGANAIELPYGYDAAQAYDPASADGTTNVTWRAAWEGDLDAVYFNATVPMSMSFMVRSDGTAIGPEAGAYQIRNYSNTAISVEDMSFEWADESELEALFGKGATDALTLSATPTAGQEGYAQTRVLLERSKATQDAVGAGLISRYVFGADKWVIAKSVGIDPDDFVGDIAALPALKLDYGLTAGGIRQLTQENTSQDMTHPIGTLKFTLKTVR